MSESKEKSGFIMISYEKFSRDLCIKIKDKLNVNIVDEIFLILLLNLKRFY